MGYSILQAENMEAAKALLADHPHLAWSPDCEVEVHEMAGRVRLNHFRPTVPGALAVMLLSGLVFGSSDISPGPRGEGGPNRDAAAD